MSDVPVDHSVTCVFCGSQADERETVLIDDDLEVIGDDMPVAYPLRYGAIVKAVVEHGRGEAHSECFEEYLYEYRDEHLPSYTVDGRFTPGGVSVSVYDGDGNVVDEAWFTWDETEERRTISQSDFTFEL